LAVVRLIDVRPHGLHARRGRRRLTFGRVTHARANPALKEPSGHIADRR
jgi:hypothetical protein